MQYPTFSADDFSKDPFFISWVVAPTHESTRFWEAFMADYPYKTDDIQMAVAFVQSIRFHEIEPSEQDLDRLKQRIWADIDPPVRVMPWYRRSYFAVAAGFALIVSAGLGWRAYEAASSLRYETAYGKIRKINLADGSQVTLNANSSLKVGEHLADTPLREVWLEGEAYFSIARRNGAKFIVHTSEATVEVLGTEFNVNTRREQTKVILREGKVQLTTGNQPALVLQPGDMATVLPQNRPIRVKKVQPALYEAWKESYIILDGKSLPEIISTLEDTFGVTIKLQNKQLTTKRLTGKLRTDVSDDCIENLAIIVEADVKKTGDTYLFD